MTLCLLLWDSSTWSGQDSRVAQVSGLSAQRPGSQHSETSRNQPYVVSRVPQLFLQCAKTLLPLFINNKGILLFLVLVNVCPVFVICIVLFQSEGIQKERENGLTESLGRQVVCRCTHAHTRTQEYAFRSCKIVFS